MLIEQRSVIACWPNIRNSYIRFVPPNERRLRPVFLVLLNNVGGEKSGLRLYLEEHDPTANHELAYMDPIRVCLDLANQVHAGDKPDPKRHKTGFAWKTPFGETIAFACHSPQWDEAIVWAFAMHLNLIVTTTVEQHASSFARSVLRM